MNINDLREIKKICFDNIAKKSKDKKRLAVSFEDCTVKMSNGEDYAGMTIDKDSDDTFTSFQISWEDFNKITTLFDNFAKIMVKEKKVIFTSKDIKFNCPTSNSELNNFISKPFSITNAIKVNMDNALIVTKEKNPYPKSFVICEDNLVSTDGCIAIINKLENNTGNEAQHFAEPLPQGTWYIDPEQRLILSEDKKILSTISKLNTPFPYKGLIDMSKQYIANWFECDVDKFKSCVEKCAMIDNKIYLHFYQDHILIKADNSENNVDMTIPCFYEHTTTRDYISFDSKYLLEYAKCAVDNKLKVMFDDNTDRNMIRVEGNNIIMFGVGLSRR